MDNTTATSLFDKFVNETNLRKAWIKARFFAITNMQYFDKVAYDTFEAHLETNLLALRQELMLEHFTFSPLRVFEIPKGDATRKLYFEEPQDAVVTHAIMNVIGERFEAVLPPNIFGHRLNIGSDESKETFKRWSELYNQYTTNARSILQLPNQMWYEISDLTNYYPSINLNNLKGTITTQVTEARLLSLLNQLFSVQALNSQEEYEGIPGLPPGPAYAHFFANIYLIDFDRFMESNTLKYYRYVDDLCFACENQDYLKDLNGKIADFFKNRSDNQLSLSSSKTEQHPVSNGLPLIEHTAKLKYDLRFGVIDTIDQISEIQVDEAKRNAERLFRDIFVSVEREEDLEKIVVKSSGIIAKKLADHVVSRHEARNIAYGLLRLNPPKISAIRALISSLMKLSFDEVEPRQRFIRFLQESSIIIRITFLQLLMGGHSLPDEIYKLLQDNFLVDDNYLVRANAFLALQTHEHSIAIELLRSLQKQETSEYVIKHSIGCFAFLPESQRNTIWIDIASILEKTSTTINTLLIIIFRLIDDNSLPYQILEILFPPIRNHSTHNVYSAISTVFLASNFGNHSMLASSWELLKEKSDAEFSNIIIQVIGFSTFRRLIQKQQTSRLFSFSDSLVELGLPELATFGYQELTVHSDDTEVQRTAREKQGTLDVGSIIPGLPSWYTLQDCDKGLYCGLSDDPEYKCRHFESDTRQINGTLEIISPSRLNSEPDFPSQQDWLNYLQTMHKVKVISLIDCDILPTGQTFALYKIPNGYLTISEWLQREHFSSSEGDVLYLVSIILEKIEKTELATGFIFNNVNPCNVLWNPATQDVLFVNIGSALGIPRYVCINEKKSALHFQKEIGATTSSYFLGLLFLQLLSKTCPVELVQKMSYSFTGQSNSIRTVTAKLDILPHTKSLVFRLLHSKPDYRYSSIVTLTGDIQHILDFKKEISSQTSIDTVSISKLILVDYITFRLKIIQRDPTISYDSTVKRTDDILYRLSHDLELYNNEDLSYWRAKVTWWERGSKLTGIPLWMWLSPESKHLVSLAHTWKELVEQVNQSLSCKYDYVLSYLLLYKLIYSELLAALQGIFVSNDLNDSKFRRCSQTVEIFNRLSDGLRELRVKPSVDTASNPIKNTYTLEQINETLRIISAYVNKQGLHFSQEISTLVSPFAIVTLFVFCYQFINEDGSIALESTPIFQVRTSKKISPNIWLTMKLPHAIEQELHRLITTQSDKPNIELNWWQESREILTYLFKLNPCKRRKVTLSKYTLTSHPREGNVKLRRLGRLQELNFSDFIVLTNGDLISCLYKKVTADVLPTPNGLKISAIFGLPRVFTYMLPKHQSFYDHVLTFWTRWKRVIILLLIIAAAFFITEILGFNGWDAINSKIPFKPLAVIVWLILWGLTAAVGDILFNMGENFFSNKRA